MSLDSVSTVYLHVVDSVVSKLREELLREGVDDDSVLLELQGTMVFISLYTYQLWELKMVQCGAVQGPIERTSTFKAAGGPTPVHDLNVPYEGTEEYETPTAEMLFPPTPLQTPIQTPLPVEQYFPAGHSEYGTAPDSGAAADMKPGRPAPYMQQPSPWMSQRPLGVDVNVAYEEGREEEGGERIAQTEPPVKDFFMLNSGKRKREDYPPRFLPNEYIPQQDGSADALLDSSFQEVPVINKCSNEAHVETTLHNRLKLQERKNIDAAIASMVRMKQTALTIPQLDGYNDIYDNGVRTEDYNTPSSYEPSTANGVGTPIAGTSEAVEDDEPPLNEDDDDDDLEDLEQGGEEPTTSHLVLAQFEKVSRTKSKWKCILKDGIMHLNNRDILFSKANGDFDF